MITLLSSQPLYHSYVCVISIDDLINRSDYELFRKVCSETHSLYHLLPPYRTSDRICVDILFSSQIIVLTCTKNRSLSDLYMNLLHNSK